MQEIMVFNYDVIDRPYVHPSMYANVTSIMLVYSIQSNLDYPDSLGLHKKSG